MLFTRFALSLLVVCSSPILFGQQNSSPAPPIAPDFPVLLQESVTAGKTPVGTKIQARLTVATLVAETVVPRNAVFLGEVTESEAKSKTAPSRLAIRVDSVEWKGGSASIKAYLSQWYYPTVADQGQALQYGPQQPASRTWNGEGQYPDPNSKVYRPFPGGDSNDNTSVPDTPNSATSPHRTAMKNVEPKHNEDGSVELISKHSDIKLDKVTTYVFSQVGSSTAR
jgi:hypothetical protein